MDVRGIATALLLLAVVLGSVRMAWFAWRRSPRPRAWRTACLLLLQLLSAMLLYRTLFPPSTDARRETLVVATAGAPSDLAAALAVNERLVALPEAGRLANAEPVPDLATALRRHRATGAIRVVGRGLGARDRDGARGLPVEFTPAPLPRGFIELPGFVAANPGADFDVRGRTNALAGGTVDLLDPAGQRIDSQTPGKDGGFVLTGAARGSGLVEFRLRARDARDRTVEEAVLPVTVSAPATPHVLLLAATPNAEVKYLRRWAADSGIRMTSQIQVGGGMQLGDPSVALDAATLKGFDAAIVDERAWDGLGAARRRALADAVRNGMGLLLRITGPVSPTLRNDLRSHGLTLARSDAPAEFTLPIAAANEFTAVRLGPGSPDAPTADTIATPGPFRLTRQPLRIEAMQGRAWLLDAGGHPLAAWNGLGTGRVGVWLPMDTFQLVLAGRGDLHARLWSDAIAAVARPAASPAPAVPTSGRQGQRLSLCGLADGATVSKPGGEPEPLHVDPAAGGQRCAGFWPRSAGWHAVRSGDQEAVFHVRTANELPGVAAFEDREAMQALSLLPPRQAAARDGAPGARWPWFLAWLLVSAGLWWLERSRPGRS